MSTDTSHVLASIDHALDDYETSVDAMRWTPEAATEQDLHIERGPVVYRIPRPNSEAVASVNRAIANMARAMAELTPSVRVALNGLGRAHLALRQQQHQRQHGGPMPLPINGHAYHRRQRARRRR